MREVDDGNQEGAVCGLRSSQCFGVMAGFFSSVGHIAENLNGMSSSSWFSLFLASVRLGPALFVAKPCSDVRFSTSSTVTIFFFFHPFEIRLKEFKEMDAPFLCYRSCGYLWKFEKLRYRYSATFFYLLKKNLIFSRDVPSFSLRPYIPTGPPHSPPQIPSSGKLAWPPHSPCADY